MLKSNFYISHAIKVKKLILLGLLLPSMAQANDEVTKFNDLALQCANGVHPNTLQALVRTESGFNPYAIGVVDGAIKQPTTFAEAVAAAKKLHEEGKNFSMGLAQINRYNLAKYDLDYESVFDPCKNLHVGQEILAECFGRAGGEPQTALQRALSCYYSGNFRTGFTQDFKGLPSYVERVKTAATKNSEEQIVKTATVEEEKESMRIPEIDVSVPTATPAVVKVKATKTKAVAKSKPEGEKVVAQAENSKKTNKWDVFGEW